MRKHIGRRKSPTHDEIANSPSVDGHHIEDWLRAEQELVGHYAELRSTNQ